MRERDNPLVRWAVYNLAWWIVKRRMQRWRRRAIAGGVIAVVVAAGAYLAATRESHG